MNSKLNIDATSRGSFMSDQIPNVEYGHYDYNNILQSASGGSSQQQ